MLAEQQLDFILLSSLERSGQSAARAGCPLPCLRQTLEHGCDNLRISAVESKRQEILSVRAWLFRVKIGRARKEQPEHFQLSVHRCRHYGRETAFVSKINHCSGIEESSRRFPILLRGCDQQRRSALRVVAVWIDALDQT